MTYEDGYYYRKTPNRYDDDYNEDNYEYDYEHFHAPRVAPPTEDDYDAIEGDDNDEA